MGASTIQTTDNAYLTVRSDTAERKGGGLCRTVPINDFQWVKAGDLIVAIEDADYRAAVAEAEANVAAAEAAIENNRAQRALQQSNIDAAQATVGASEADMTRYDLELTRQQTLLAANVAGTRQLVEQAEANDKRATAAFAQAKAQVEAQRRQLTVIDAQSRQLEAALAAQQALLDIARVNLGYTRIVAPVDGMVGRRQVQAGQYLGVGSQIVSIVPLPRVWVIANYKETQMTNIRAGQPVEISVDAFPEVSSKGGWIAGRRRAARCSRFCLPTMRPAILPRWSSAFRSRLFSKVPARCANSSGQACQWSYGFARIAEMIPTPQLGRARDGTTRRATTSGTAFFARARPYIGIIGVLVGTVISTLNGRITAFGLADIRGAVHADFDEGAWITTAFTAAQMLIAFPSVWLGLLVGARRVLLWSGAVYTIASLALPLSPDLPTLLFWQTIAGLSSGTFIPLTIGFVLRNLPARLVAYGLSVYAMNSELSQNVAASLEGWFIEHWSWEWIFWCNGLLAPVMMLCLAIGAPKAPINQTLLASGNWSGIAFCSVGFALLYAGLDQGNRLDWLNSGLVSGYFCRGPCSWSHSSCRSCSRLIRSSICDLPCRATSRCWRCWWCCFVS